MAVRIHHDHGVIKGTVTLPASKSISNRLLIIKVLCHDSFQIDNLSTARDTIILQNLLGFPETILDAEDAGTSFRFLTSLLAITPGNWELTGSTRMKLRPVGMLVNALRTLGASIEYLEEDGFPPLKITGQKLKGGLVEVDGSISSQFVSSLLMISPLIKGGIKIRINPPATSAPYVQMTLLLMQEFGIQVRSEDGILIVPEQNYTAKNFRVEPDWSAASYWYEIAALSKECDIFFPGLIKSKFQGDAVITGIMEPFGVRSEFTSGGTRIYKQSSIPLPEKFEFDFRDYPDLVPALTGVCTGLKVPFSFSGVRNLRVKESNRLETLRDTFGEFGCRMIIQDDVLSSVPDDLTFDPRAGHTIEAGTIRKIQSFNDHRIALSAAPLSICNGPIEIDDEHTIDKSYPEFWNHLSSTGFGIEFTAD